MNAQHKQGWVALKSAEKLFMAWADSRGIALERIEYVATFENWDRNTEVYVFFPTDADLARHKATGVLREVEACFRQFLAEAQYPSDRWPVVFYFDSHENVVRNYEGSYFYRLR